MLHIDASYRLTTEGQRAEIIRTGQPVALENTLSGEIDPALLEQSRAVKARSKINGRGEVTLDMINGPNEICVEEQGVYVYVDVNRTTLAADIATLIADLDAAIVAALERKLAERQQKRDETRSKTLETLNSRSEKQRAHYVEGLKEATGSNYINVPVCDWPASTDSEVINSPEALAWEADVERRQVALVAEAKQTVEAYQARQAELAQAKQEFSRQYVAEHMPGDLGRFDAGLMCTDEVHGHMRDHVFEPLADCKHYQKITKRQVLGALEIDYDEEVIWQTETPGCISATAYSRKQQIETLLPGCSVEFREHSGSIDRNDVPWVCRRIGLLVTMPFGPFKFSREFAT